MVKNKSFISLRGKLNIMFRMSGIGKNLRKRAKELKLSDAEIARRLGISARRYSYYVNDAREPDFQMLRKIGSVLKMSFNDLFAK